MTAAIYARQSVDPDGRGAAVGRQLDECRDLVARLGLDGPVREFVDNDTSASRGPRPEFERLMSEIRQGRVTDVVVWHPDRLYRRLSDLAAVIELAEAHHLTIRTVSAGDIDLTTATGRLLAGILGNAARFEVEQKAARQAAANLQRARDGQWHFSVRPYGYERVDGQVRVVTAEAEVIRWMCEQYLHGRSYYWIAADLNSRSIPSTKGAAWSTTTVRDRLTNARYAGFSSYRGEQVASGEWESIIDRGTWERLEALRTRRRVRHEWSNRVKYLLSGLAVCGVCNGRLMARPETRGKRTRHVYACSSRWCVERDLEHLDSFVAEVVVARLQLPDAAAALAVPAQAVDIARQAQVTRDRMRDLASLLAEGVLRAPEVREQQAVLTKRLEALEARAAVDDGTAALHALLRADDLRSRWEGLPLESKRDVIRCLMVVKVHRQGGRRFDPACVEIEWKGATEAA